MIRGGAEPAPNRCGETNGTQTQTPENKEAPMAEVTIYHNQN